ncbi:MAG: hypothetical protein AAF668_07830 [Pseudomonadota bacterium]
MSVPLAIAVLAVRLMSLFFVVTALQNIFVQGTYQLLTQEEDNLFWVVQVTYGAAQLLLGVILWLTAERIARFVATGVTKPAATTSTQNKEWSEEVIAAGSFLIGAFYIIQFAPSLALDMAASIWRSWTTAAHSGTYDDVVGFMFFNVEDIIRNSLSLLASLFLMLKPRFLVVLFRAARRSGIAQGVDNASET